MCDGSQSIAYVLGWLITCPWSQFPQLRDAVIYRAHAVVCGRSQALGMLPLPSIYLHFDAWQLLYVAKSLVPDIFYSSLSAKIFSFWGQWDGIWNNWQFCWLGITVMLLWNGCACSPCTGSWSLHSRGCLFAGTWPNQPILRSCWSEECRCSALLRIRSVSGKFAIERNLGDCIWNVSGL